MNRRRPGGNVVRILEDTGGWSTLYAHLDMVAVVDGATLGLTLSIALDGISLTAFDLTDDTFRVAVIPHTADVTTLGVKGPGAVVNIELDVLAKHIERLLQFK